MPDINFQRKFNRNDEYLTPDYAVLPILKYLPKDKCIIWCPFDKEDSAFVKIFDEAGHDVFYSHIDDGGDFFKLRVPKCDYIISNPPFSLKTEILQRLCSIDKPFAILLNFQGIFDSKVRFDLGLKYNLELMYMYPRVDFIATTRELNTSIPFQSGYLCHKILGKPLAFEYINREIEK